MTMVCYSTPPPFLTLPCCTHLHAFITLLIPTKLHSHPKIASTIMPLTFFLPSPLHILHHSYILSFPTFQTTISHYIHTNKGRPTIPYYHIYSTATPAHSSQHTQHSTTTPYQNVSPSSPSHTSDTAHHKLHIASVPPMYCIINPHSSKGENNQSSICHGLTVMQQVDRYK